MPLLAKLTEPIEVHLSGGGSDLPGQIIIAALALLGVLITVLTANWRHRKQLENERQLRRQDLDHDRYMRDREHIRDRIERTMDLLTKTVSALSGAQTSAEVLETARVKEKEAEGSGDADAELKTVEEAFEAEKRCARRLRKAQRASARQTQATVRLRLWLGDDDPITEAHFALAAQLSAWYSTSSEAFEESRTREQIEYAEGLSLRVPDRVKDFEGACRKYVEAPVTAKTEPA